MAGPEGPDETQAGEGPVRRWRPVPRSWRTRVLAGLAGALLLWGLVATALGVLGARAARSGADRVRALELSVGLRELTDEDTARALDHARRDMRRADRLLGHPILAPAQVLPIVGRQLRTTTALTGTATDLLDASDRALSTLRREIDDGPRSGPGRVAALASLIDELQAIEIALGAADLGPSEALVEPLHRARGDMERKLIDAQTKVVDLLAVLESLHELLQGPSRYVVLAANNAEMRIGAGMYLSIGAVEIDDGHLQVHRDFAPAKDVVLAQPVPLPEPVGALWGWSAVGTDWRDLGFTARFPVNAALAAQMWNAIEPGDVDGVLMVDVDGLRALLEAVGPVRVDGLVIDADNASDYLLHDQYAGADDDSLNAERREQLSRLAEAVLEALSGSDVNLLDLVDRLRHATNGRHLLAWSADPRIQAGWEIANADGELESRSLLVGLANVDGSKLDPYIDLSVTMDVDERSDGRAFDLRVEITNRVPSGLPRYVNGTDASPTYRGLLSAHVPATAQLTALTGFDGITAAGQDGPTAVIAAPVTVPQGESRTGHLRFVLPTAAAETLRIESSARMPPARWSVDGHRRDDDFAWELTLRGR